ncbi:DUF4133 domain-containing protein [Bacteroides sp. CG01]|uniref:DUF4133 domain-containing protein n=1 Tax=Bacteroides sp. CG01 TaxID=3096000 RepID=UPI002AFF5447|nr:DUF4133 domain-containing protein [Bacteroides sp. CG01]
MAEYLVNKGVDKSIEFWGLKGQYIVLVALGAIGLFFLSTILLALNTSVWLVVSLIGICAFALIRGSRWMNTHMGESGLTKLQASFSRYHFLSNRKIIAHILSK